MTPLGQRIELSSTPRGPETDLRTGGRTPREIARAFEELILRQLVGAMRKTIPDSGTLEGGAVHSTLDGVFEERLSHALAQGRGIGLADAILRQIEQVTGPRGASEPGAAGAPAEGGAAADRGAVAPVAGRVTSAFGPRIDPLTGADDFHGGLDLAAPAGTPVSALLEGEVSEVGWRGNAGRVVVLRHPDGLVSRYAHLGGASVKPGDEVAAGQGIGSVGTTGRTTGPHLHLVVEKDGAAVDPAPYLGRRAAGQAGAAVPLRRGDT